MSAAERHDQVRRLFERARHLPPNQREAFLQVESESVELMQEVRSLLAQAETDDGFLETPVLAHRVRIADFLEFAEEVLPDRIGPYRIMEVLGDGGFARVYRAQHDNDPGVDVALKLLRPGYENRRMLARFDIETQALSMLDHPGIARLIDAGVLADRRPYFAMEIVHGRPITEHCAAAKLDRRDVLELFMRVCAAVEHAHVRGIVHRDLKPSNILVTDSPVGPMPKIIDFGVARIVQGNSPARWQTTSRGHLIGTLEYMSPEQCSNSITGIDTRADVYALGVLLYELLTGRRPFNLREVPLPEASRIIAHDAPPPVSFIDRTLKGDLQIIIEHAMAKDRADRYQSARELAEDIRLFLGQQPIRARGPNTLYQIRRHAARHKSKLIVASIVLVAMLALLIQGLIGWHRSHQHYLKAKETISFMLEVVVNDLSNQPGQTEVRQTILNGILDRAEPFLLGGSTDIELDIIHARALGGLGELERERGDVDAALAYQLRSLQVHEHIQQDHADEAGPLVEAAHSITLVKIGDLAKESGDREAAYQWYQQALQIDEQLARDEPDNFTLQDNLAWSYERMADMAHARGDAETATRFMQLRVGQVRLLEQMAPDDERVLHNQLCIHQVAAGVAHQENNESAELEHRRLALELATQLAQRFPDHRLYLTRLALAHGALAGLEMRRSHLDKAEALLTKATKISKDLVKSDKENVDTRAVFVEIHMQYADLCVRQGNPVEALEALEQAVGHAQTIQSMKPGDPYVAGLYAAAQQRLAALMPSP